LAVLSQDEQIALDEHLARNETPSNDETHIRPNNTHLQNGSE
jgi:hypothetical protein